MPPDDQNTELRALREEFEAGESNDTNFAKALDRLQPLIQNIHTDGGTWVEAGVLEAQVHERSGPTISKGSNALWRRAQELVRAHFSK